MIRKRRTKVLIDVTTSFKINYSPIAINEIELLVRRKKKIEQNEKNIA
jgi:hypothetical protein